MLIYEQNIICVLFPARLPFQILSPGVESSSPLIKNSNKRKLSDSTDDIKIIKTIRPNDLCQPGETKENVCSPTFSGDCKKSSDSTNKTLTTPCAGKEVTEHANNSSKTSEVFETIINLDEAERGGVNDSVSLNEVDRMSKSSSNKEKETCISNKGPADGVVDPDVIVCSDSEGNVEKEGLTISRYKVMPTEAQDKVPKNETVDSKQDVTNSPLNADSEQRETEKSPIAVKDSLYESKSGRERLIPEECTANSESDISKQMSPKSVDTEANKCVPHGVKTPKLSPPQCSVSEINSKKNTTDIARTPRPSHQNSPCDDNFKDSTPNSETSSCGSLDSTQKIRKLTPKQLLKQLESAKKKEEKERRQQVIYFKLELVKVSVVVSS
jgi:hypothetical protein